MKQQSVHTKHNNPVTSQQNLTNYNRRQQKYKHTQKQNTEKMLKPYTNTAEKTNFIWPIYFETPYFQTFPETPQRQKRN